MKKNSYLLFTIHYSLLTIFCFSILFIPITFAALPGQMNLKHGHQMYILPTRDKEFYGEYVKYFYKGNEILLPDEEIKKIEHLLEKKLVKGVNRYYIKDFLKKYIEPKVNKDSSNISMKLKDDKVVFSSEIIRGEKLNIDVSAKIIEYALNNKLDEIELAVDFIDPVLDIQKSLLKTGVKEIVSIGESNFSGSTLDRIHNIKTAIANFNWVIIKKWKGFSFNKIVWRIDGTTGYKKELVIKGANTIKEWGGWVCQTSSTLYRSILLAWLPINERRGHSYAVSYYAPWGTDATIYPWSADLKFTNDTNSDLVIHTYVKDEKLFFIFLWTQTDKKIDLFGPYIANRKSAPPTRYIPSKTLSDGEVFFVSPAHAWFTSTWFRVIDWEHERIKTVYKPMPKIYKVWGLEQEKRWSLN